MISIIIINYLQKDLIMQCVDSVYRTTSSFPFEIIIVNNSPEESLKKVLEKYPDVKIIPNENQGFSQANNLAAGLSKGDYLLFLNGDTIFKNDFFGDLINKVKDIEYGAIGLKLYNTDGSFQLSFWKENNFNNEQLNKKAEKAFSGKDLNFIEKIEKEHHELSEVEWVSGASLFISRKRFNEVNGFDENFFLFYEDADLCQRQREKGYKIYFYPGSHIIHLKGENVNKNFQSSTYYYVKESQLLYYKKHNPVFDRIALRIYLFFKFLLLSATSFRKINFRILKLVIGIK